MSKEFKRKASEEAAEETSYETKQETMPFSDWFVIRLKTHGKLQAHHYDSILAFFKNTGLAEQESAEDYDSALKIFGF